MANRDDHLSFTTSSIQQFGKRAHSQLPTPDSFTWRCDNNNKKPCPSKKSMAKAFCFVSSCDEWESLPQALLFVILTKLLEPIDHLRFSAVCKHWLCAAKEYHRSTHRWRNHKQLPMLLIPNSPPESESIPRVVYSIAEGKVYNNFHLALPYGKRCCGFSHGWFATIDLADQPINITLINPFRKRAAPIRLPPLEFKAKDMIPSRDMISLRGCTRPFDTIENFDPFENKIKDYDPYEDYVHKVILSADPILYPRDYFVVAIYGKDVKTLAFKYPGLNFWTTQSEHCADALFYKGQVYAIGPYLRVLSIASYPAYLSGTEYTLLTQYQPYTHGQELKGLGFRAYLVKSTNGDLFRVQIVPKPSAEARSNIKFNVYKLVFHKRQELESIKHFKVKNILGEAFFIGSNGSFSVLASDFLGCKPNCIYYMAESVKKQVIVEGQPCNMVMLNLEDETITPIRLPNPNWAGTIQPATWFMPPFHISGLNGR